MERRIVQGTQVWRVNPQAPEAEAIAAAAAVIRSGGLVAFPTETVYGLGANALDATAVERIFIAKERPSWDPLIVHVSRWEMVEQVAREVGDLFQRLGEHFWPGPLTLVVPKAPTLPEQVTAGLPTVAVRMPSHPVALALIEAAGRPIAAPSANRFGRPSPTRPEHVLADLAGRIEMLLDGGPTEVGVESTVLDLTVRPPRVLRPGGVTLEALQALLGQVEGKASPPPPLEGLPSPGMLPTHYAPSAQVLLFEGEAGEQGEAMRARAEQLLAAGKRVGALAFEDLLPILAPLPMERFLLGKREDLKTIARNLFTGLRALDALGVEVILCPLPPPRGLGRAVRDRLLRAAGKGGEGSSGT